MRKKQEQCPGGREMPSHRICWGVKSKRRGKREKVMGVLGILLGFFNNQERELCL